jgi:hypothetical protein
MKATRPTGSSVKIRGMSRGDPSGATEVFGVNSFFEASARKALRIFQADGHTFVSSTAQRFKQSRETSREKTT